MLECPLSVFKAPNIGQHLFFKHNTPIVLDVRIIVYWTLVIDNDNHTDIVLYAMLDAQSYSAVKSGVSKSCSL